MLKLILFLLSANFVFGQEVVKNQFLVKFKDKTRKLKSLNLAQIKSLKLVKSFTSIKGLSHIKLDKDQLKNFAQTFDGDIEYIEPVYKVKAFGILPEQWGMRNPSGPDINVEAAWEFTKGSPHIVVGVIDTGIDLDHEGLRDSLFKNPLEIPNNNIDDDNNGYIDDVHGWNFYDGTNNSDDDNGHGTHCAGIIAGRNTLSGVAPNIKVVPLKFLSDEGMGTTADAIEAIDYSIKMGFQITNNSWGGAGESRALKEMIEKAHEKGQLFVAAAGNSGTNLDDYPEYPAGYTTPNVVSVANIEEDGNLNSWSNYSSSLVHIAAPGTRIYSTYPDDSYQLLTGTSMAAPFVAGSLALLWSYYPDWNALEVKERLLESARPLDTVKNKVITNGIVDIGAAFKNDDKPETPIWDDVKIDRTKYRRWYQIYYRLILKVDSTSKFLNEIKQVEYHYKKRGRTYRIVGRSASNNFRVRFKTDLHNQEVEYFIILKDGREIKGISLP